VKPLERGPAECDSVCPALFDSLLLRVEDSVNDFETSKLWELTWGSTPNLLAYYLYLWETAVVKQAFEMAYAFCLVRLRFVELLVPAG
jgi:hypothetical protein